MILRACRSLFAHVALPGFKAVIKFVILLIRNYSTASSASYTLPHSPHHHFLYTSTEKTNYHDITSINTVPFQYTTHHLNQGHQNKYKSSASNYALESSSTLQDMLLCHTARRTESHRDF